MVNDSDRASIADVFPPDRIAGRFVLSMAMATKHKCVHYMKVKLNLPNHVIAAQMGWSEAAVEKMVATYAHAETHKIPPQPRRLTRFVRPSRLGNGAKPGAGLHGGKQ